MFAGRMAAAARRFPRRVPLEPRFAELLPEVLFAIGPQEFAALAARALTPKAPPVVSVEHIHAPFVSIREQAVLIAGRLRGLGRASFRQLSAGATGQLRDRRVVPRAARAVPGGRGRVRAGHAARRAVRDLDGRRPRGRARSPPGAGSVDATRPPEQRTKKKPTHDQRLHGRQPGGAGRRHRRRPGRAGASGPAGRAGRARPARKPRGDPAGRRRAGTRGAPRPGTRAAPARGRRRACARWRPSTRGTAAASTCGRSRAAGASILERTAPRSWSGSSRDGQEVRLTQAALETLAVIAYRQPVSRARVSAVRGVNCDGVIRTLVLRGLVEDSGSRPGDRRDPVPHHRLLP